MRQEKTKGYNDEHKDLEAIIMTVKYLYELCKKEIEKGNGDRNIIICANDEYIPLENHFSLPYDDDELSKVLDEWGVTEKEAIVLN